MAATQQGRLEMENPEDPVKEWFVGWWQPFFEREHRDIVRETVFCVHFDDLLFPVPSQLSVPRRIGEK